eukprot:102196-Chlamydomonas_euryale.AAC.1
MTRAQVRPLLRRGGRHRRDGRDRPRQCVRDRHVRRQALQLRALGQRRRPVPGGRAHVQALCLHRALVGAQVDRLDRRVGRAGRQRQGRHARHRGHAHPASPQRGRERGVAVGQGPLPVRRPQAPAPQRAHGQGAQRAAGGVLGRGARRGQGGSAWCHRRRDQGGRWEAGRRRVDGVRQGPAQPPGQRQHGARGRRHAVRRRALVVHCQLNGRGRGAGRPHPAGRHQPSVGGARVQRAHPQGHARRHAGRHGRRARRPYLQGVPGWWGV